MATVALRKVTKVYDNGFEAVHGLDLDVAEGEFMVLVGPSGCGKTTALRMVAGLEDITGGTLEIGGKVVNDLSPKERDIAMVFQNYGLYPHMTVGQNIGFALKVAKLPKSEIKEKVRSAADILGLTEWLDRKPGQLSGGQRQRVAMGRAIVREPSVFLMDEPLSNLDAKLRVQMRAEVSRIQQQLQVSTIYVTHDQIEAMTMGDRVAVMRGGVLMQCDDPQVLYEHPLNMFVAAFIGSPAMNLYRATVAEDGSSLEIGSQTVVLADVVPVAHPGLARYLGRDIVVGMRPEHLPTPRDGHTGPVIEADVKLVEALGSELLVHFRLDAQPVTAEGTTSDDEGVHMMAGASVARVEPKAPVKAGQRAHFAVDTERMHFFDSETKLAIWE